MSLPTLDSLQLETLRGTTAIASSYVGRVRISANPNTVIYSARVNQATFANSYAQITFDGGSGTLADILPGMRVILSRTNDKSLYYWSGRVRKAPTSTVLYIGETSVDIHDNDWITVLNDFPIDHKLAREVSGVEYKDFDIAFTQQKPVIYNLRSAYAGDIDSDDVLTISFAPSALAATSGTTISSWSWDVGDGSITAGTSSTQNITVEFPEGHRWIHLTVTDSGGRASVRHVEIHAHGDTYTYQLVAVDDVNTSAAVNSGFDATLTNYAPVADMIDLTQITIWADDSHQTGNGTVTDDNILFVGRIRNRENETTANDEGGIDKVARYTVEGPLTQLARTEQLAFQMLNVASPAKWGDIKTLTMWRAMVYLLQWHSTFLELHSLTFSDTTDTYIAPLKNPSGDVLAAVNDIAFSINAAMECEPNGTAHIVRHGSALESSTLRNALNTRANVAAGDLRKITVQQDPARPFGRMKCAGGSYNTTTGQYLVTESLAPGVAQDAGSQQGTLDRQVLPSNLGQAAADTLLKTRGNLALEKAQEAEKLDVTFKAQWRSVLIPSLDTWWTFDVPADLTVDGEAMGKTILTSSIRWLLVSAKFTHDAEGKPQVEASFIRETDGISKGLTIVYPPSAPSAVPSYPGLPPLPMFPVPPIGLPDTPDGTEIPPGTVIINLRLDGNSWIVGGDRDGIQTLLLTTTMLLMAIPYTRDIVPDDLTTTEVLKDLKANPFGDKHGAYVLYYDTVLETSSVRYTEDFTAYPVVWAKGEDIVGQYTEMRLGKANGILTLLGGVTTSTDCADDWEVQVGTETARTGTTITADSGMVGPSDYRVVFAVTGATLHPSASFCRRFTYSSDALSLGWGWFACANDFEDTGLLAPLDVCIWQVQMVNNLPFTTTINLSDPGGCGDCNTGVTGTVTVYSTDYGATFADQEPTDVIASWIDYQKAGTVTLVGGGDQTQTSDAGGAWSDYGSTKAQGSGYVPRNLLTASGSNSSSNPQFVLFADVLDTGASMWAVSSSGAAFTDISPDDGTDIGLSTGPRCVLVHWQTYGTTSHILAIASFDGVLKLAVSLDRGSTWHVSAALDDTAFGIAALRGDLTKKLCGWANGSKVAIVKNYQATTPTFVERTLPITNISALDAIG